MIRKTPVKKTPEKILAQQQRTARIKEKTMKIDQLRQEKDTRTSGRRPTSGRVGRRMPTSGRVGRRMPTSGRVGRRMPTSGRVGRRMPTSGRVGRRMPTSSNGRQRKRRNSNLIRVNNESYQSYMEEKKKIIADADNKEAILLKQKIDFLHKLEKKFPGAGDQEFQELQLANIKYNQLKLKNKYKNALNANSYDSTKVSESQIGNHVVITPTDNNYNQYMEEKKKINADADNKEAILSKQTKDFLDKLEKKFPGAGDREFQERQLAYIKDKGYDEYAKYYENRLNNYNFNTGDRLVTEALLDERVLSPLSPLNTEPEFNNQYKNVNTKTMETMPTIYGTNPDMSTESTKKKTVDMPTIYGTNPDMSTVSTKIDTLR